MIDTAALREKVLDLAIRGKLVPQDPNDEPASVLLERIRAQKLQMVREGKLKAKDIKDDTIIFKGDDNCHYEKFADGTIKNIQDEIPFELPDGWAWCRLQTFCFPISDGTHQTPTYTNEGYIFLSAKNVTSWKIDWDNVMHIPESLHNELSKRISPKKNDILLAKNGTIGVAAIVDRDCDFDIYVTLAVLRTINTSILPQYLLNAIATSTIQNEFRSTLKGIGVQNLHLEHIRRTLIPIPPYNEQTIISEKVEEIIPLLEYITDTYVELDSAISILKSKILELAIQGKLVEQDETDEPASVLLERIRAEKKAQLGKKYVESYIYKGDDNCYYEKVDKNKTVLVEDLPFDIPETWAFIRLENALIYEQPTEYIVESTDYNNQYPIPVLTAGKSFIIGYTNEMRGIKNDLPVIIFDDFTTDSKYVDFPFKVKSSAMKILTAEKDIINTKFAFYVMQTIDCDHETHKRYWISEYGKKVIGLPPLKEQLKIVNTIEYLFSLLD